MGVAVSNWKLAKAVSNFGSLGVVSGTGIANIMIARLMSGDTDGHVRRAMSHFPIQESIKRIIDKYYQPVEDAARKITFKRPPMWQFKAPKQLTELTVVANFVEVFLAREGKNSSVGLNLLEKVQFPTMASLYGAMLAGVSVVLIGAGIPDQIPEMMSTLSRHEATEHQIAVQGGTGKYGFTFEPEAVFPGIGQAAGPLTIPRFLPIVSSDILAKALMKRTGNRLDGFIVEAPWAGGHNAPPRGPLKLNNRGEPEYGSRDEIQLDKFRRLGLPFWLAGGYDSEEKYRYALENGAAGIQVGTAFAFSDESGLHPDIKQQVINQVLTGPVSVYTSSRISPTGFPFKVVRQSGTVSDQSVLDLRTRLCDIGLLRQAKMNGEGEMVYFCSAEPSDSFVRKGGAETECSGRSCLCNNLMASAGFPQTRSCGYTEPPLITAGDGLQRIERFIPEGGNSYSVENVLDVILGKVPASASPVPV